MEKKEKLESMLDAKDIADAFGVARQTIHVWMKSTDFPKPSKIGHKNYWRKSTIDDYIDKKKREKEKEELR
jgi:predicted DNA-binding transcriptional regulator AlpA